MRIILTFSLLLCLAMVGCKKTPASSREQDRKVPQRLEGQIPESELKQPENPITSGALRVEVRWLQSMPEINSSLVAVGELIAPGPNFSGNRPETGDSLIIDGLTEASFADIEVLIIEVLPPRDKAEGIPKMTLLKIVE